MGVSIQPHGRNAAAEQKGKGLQRKIESRVCVKAHPSFGRDLKEREIEREIEERGAIVFVSLGKADSFLQSFRHVFILPAGLPQFTSTHLPKRVFAVSSTRQ